MTYIYHGNVSVPHNKLQVGSRDKTMADKLVYIPNENAQIYPFCRIQLVVEETFGHSNSIQNLM